MTDFTLFFWSYTFAAVSYIPRSLFDTLLRVIVVCKGVEGRSRVNLEKDDCEEEA